jgi:hypothetical protein
VRMDPGIMHRQVFVPLNFKDTLVLLVFLIIVIAVVLYYDAAYSDSCTRPHPDAQTIIDCMNKQPTPKK